MGKTETTQTNPGNQHRLGITLGILGFRGQCLHFLSFCPIKNLDSYKAKHTDVILVTEIPQGY